MHNDVTIKTTKDNQELVSSKFILSARSKYFEAMFNGQNFKESTGMVEMPCTQPVMEKVIHFLYSGEVNYDNMTGIELLEYLDILRHLMLDRPFKHLEEVILSKIGKGDFRFGELIRVLEKAIDLQLEDTADCIFLYIATNYQDAFVEAKEELTTMRTETFMHQILIKIDDPWNCIERIQLYSHWVGANADKLSKDQRKEIQDSFNFEDFKIEELLGEVYKSGLLETEQIFGSIGEKFLDMSISYDEVLREKGNLEKGYLKLEDEKNKIEVERDNLVDKKLKLLEKVKMQRNKLAEKEEEIRELKSELAHFWVNT